MGLRSAGRIVIEVIFDSMIHDRLRHRSSVRVLSGLVATVRCGMCVEHAFLWVVGAAGRRKED